MMVVCIGICILRLLKIGLFLLLCLIFEGLVFGLILATSVALIYWITRGILQVINVQRDWSPGTVESCNIIQVCFVCWLLGMFKLKWVKSWSLVATPKSLQSFKEHFHQLYAWSRTITVIFLLVGSTCIQVITFFAKFYGNSKGNLDDLQKLVYVNDLKFLGSLLLLVYLCIRIFRHYRDTSKTQDEIELRDVVRSPRWQLYLEHYYGLLAYELFLTDLVIMVLLGLGVILEENHKLHCWFPYVCGCFVATGLGVVLGDVEERLLWLDNQMEEDYPYYRTVHWDVRLHLLAFFFLPMLSLLYFRIAEDPIATMKAELLHNLLHLAFIGVFWMAIAKGNTLFSYVVRGHYWRHRQGRGGQLDRRDVSRRYNSTPIARHDDIINNNRVVPQRQSSSSSSTNDGRMENHLLGDRTPPNMRVFGIATVLKNILADYFPVDVKIRKGTDQGSVSTGTCTSLMTRQVNIETGSVCVQIPQQSASETQVDDMDEVRDGQLENHHEEERGSQMDYNSRLDIKLDVEDTKSSEVSYDRACDINRNIAIEEGTKVEPQFKADMEVTFSSDVEDHEAPIPLKRCPSTKLPVTYSD